jgi:agmatine deiminase
MKKIILFCLVALSLYLQAQPEAPVRYCAEWEAVRGTLIRWPLGIPPELVYNLAMDDSLFVLVENEAESAAALYSLSSYGVNTEHCRFIYAVTNSHWTRDWGPQNIFYGDNQWGIIDPEFDGYPWVPGGREYDDDNVVNQILGDEFDCEVFYLPAYLTGGNIMTDGQNTAFSTQQMLAENYGLGWNNEDFFNLINEYCGITDYQILPNIENHGIQHIDCGAKLLNEETVMIKRLPDWHPEYQRMESIDEEFARMQNCYGRDYTIIRIDCPPYSGGNCAAYTNSYILNHKVLVPMFGIPADSQALATYQEAMPGYEVIGIYFNAWYYYDALHCRVREIIDRDMLYMQHRPLDPLMPANQDIDIFCRIIPYSGAELNMAQLYLMWRETGNSQFNYQNLIATVMQDTFTTQITALDTETDYEYYITAVDYSGRTETLPRTAPAALYTFSTDNSSDSPLNELPPANLSNFTIFPNPFNPDTSIKFSLYEQKFISIKIFDITGKIIDTIYKGFLPEGDQMFRWLPDDAPSGIYLVSIYANGILAAKSKCLLIK